MFVYLFIEKKGPRWGDADDPLAVAIRRKREKARTHGRTHARTDARMLACMHARAHTHSTAHTHISGRASPRRDSWVLQRLCIPAGDSKAITRRGESCIPRPGTRRANLLERTSGMDRSQAPTLKRSLQWYHIENVLG